MLNPNERVARRTRPNKPCPCGSGKKFKRCCEFRPDERKPEVTEDGATVKIRRELTPQQDAVLDMLEKL